MTNEIKKYLAMFALIVAIFIGGFCSGYYYQSGRLDRLQERLDIIAEQQQETARKIGQAETGIDTAKETGRIEDSVDESRRVEQSTTEILERIQERIEKVEAENR